ncbi:MAG: hypothetical protein JXB13_06205 [Phycisphaerae bacterium]|nr:hypothetical protein [Phycisphaerae bacterium]
MRWTWIALLTLVVVAAGVLLMVLRGRWRINEGWCTLRYQKGPSSDDSIMINMVERMLMPLPGKPGQVRDLPPGAGLPRFYQLECGDGSSIVLCLLPGRRLYVDTDRDGLFSDERCIQGVECGPPGRDWEYGPVRLKSASKGGTVPRFRVRSFRQDIPSPVFVHPDGYQTGWLRIDGRAYRFAAVDGDHDGRFSTLLSLPVADPWRRQCDLIAVDRDGDGEFHHSGRRCEVMPLGRMVIMHDRYYAIDLAPDGSRLELRAAQPTMGELVIDCPGVEFECELMSDVAPQSLYWTYESKSHPLPAGAYGVGRGMLRTLNADGRPLAFQCDQPGSSLQRFEIKEGETTTLKIGAPFVITAEVRRSGSRVDMKPILRDCAGSVYVPTVFGHAGSWSPSPLAFSILDEQGKRLDGGQFAYSLEGTLTSSWRVPAGFKGKYRVQIDLDVGCFKAGQEEIWHLIE